MMKKLHDGLTFASLIFAGLTFTRKPARKEESRFNGQLLDQKRDEVFVAMRQIGLIR
ncbi:hypothetical protein [Pseudarthrobacter sp. S9]|uniref:hypothetical protein n=1 Tax=Pseudarthrobacter sp. S9 TaxID=3418421 RepID=UPI003CFC2F67